MTNEGECRTCKAAVLWITLEPRNKPHPVNPVPVEGGSIRCTLEGGRRTGRVLPYGARTGKLYMSHFATCPDADKWRGAGS